MAKFTATNFVMVPYIVEIEAENWEEALEKAQELDINIESPDDAYIGDLGIDERWEIEDEAGNVTTNC